MASFARSLCACLLLAVISGPGCKQCKAPSATSAAPALAPLVPITADAAGRFVFHDYYTADPAAAIAFYTAIAGWHTQGTPGGVYTVLSGSNGAVAGIGALSPEMRARGVKAYWVGTVIVPDVDAVVETARGNGAKIFQEPTDMSFAGRFASLADPSGAAFIVSRPAAAPTLRDNSTPGEFYWNELVTADAAAAMTFYKRLFEWEQMTEAPVDQTGKYLTFGTGGIPMGGIHGDPKFTSSGWLYYIQVANLDVAVESAKAMGAKVLFGPTSTPDGRVVHMVDPGGANFSLHDSKK